MSKTWSGAASIVAAVAVTVLCAPPAAADEAGYLNALRGRWASVTDQQFLTEGAKVCSVTRSGTSSADATLMVQKDLQMGVTEALRVVGAAIVHLGC
jgi:hypothetical protein